MSKTLTDTQLVLLATAHQRNDGNLLPPAESITLPPARLHRPILNLIGRGLAEEHRTNRVFGVWRRDEDGRIGVRITTKGRRFLDGDNDDPSAKSSVVLCPGASLPPPVTVANEEKESRSRSKLATVLQLVEQEGGATLTELVVATGWQKHSIRAALTGLRKKGHPLQRFTTEEGPRYRSLSASDHGGQ